jgi:hypothetical protein
LSLPQKRSLEEELSENMKNKMEWTLGNVNPEKGDGLFNDTSKRRL